MKDLKHLIYFENLLQDAQNELVSKAVEQGMHPLGYNCYYIPEVLLNLPGCFSSRLRAPRCNSTDVANYYMTTRNCPYVRAILERAIEGGYNYLEALFGAEGCAAMAGMGVIQREGIFHAQLNMFSERIYTDGQCDQHLPRREQCLHSHSRQHNDRAGLV